ncbi:MAG: GNAT family N-acetyltransferase [Planctomycetota bacterium]
MPAPSVKIRRATVADAAKITEFNLAMARETEDKTLDGAIAAEGARQGLSDPSRSLYFVAEVEGVVVGQTMITTEWSDWRNGFFWWIQSVYVDPKHRRTGVFRGLHEHIREAARAREDVCGLRLYVHHQNERAMNTYRRLGMRQTEYLLCEEDWSCAR